MRPVQIWIGSYYHMSGGVRALHSLRDELLQRGFQSWMTYQLPAINHPDAITVYPEIVNNNPWDATRIVRWKLNRIDLPDDGLTYSWETGMGDHPLLTVNIIEDFWYPRPNTKTSNVGYWIGKGTVDQAVLPKGAQLISRDNHPDRKELAAYIASLDYLVSFDPLSIVNLEAVISGTPVHIHAPGHTWDHTTIRNHGWLPYGVTWAGNIDKARATIPKAREHYEALKVVFSSRVDSFVEDIETEWP